MGQANKPRNASMQYWPRKRAARETAYVRSWAHSSDVKPLGFAGYKVGMSHCIIVDNRPTSITKGMDLSCSVTIIECPPLKASSVRFYKNVDNSMRVLTDIMASSQDKDLKRRISMPKKIKKDINDIKPEDFDDLTILVNTQPRLTGIGKKKPELFEIALGGKKQDKLAYAKEKLGKEIFLKDIFKEGQQVDIHAITKGKGYQGPVKRFGVSIRSHKAEKTKRGPGSLGAWRGQRHMMYRVAHAGQMGYHQRTEYNKWVMKIGDKPSEINPISGFKHYGVVKNSYIIIKGSVHGSSKRLIRFNAATRPNRKIPQDVPAINDMNIRTVR